MKLRLTRPRSALERAAAVGPRWEALVFAAAYTGLRWGELAGLRRCDVDLERNLVTVTRKLGEVNGALSFSPPKTAAGKAISSRNAVKHGLLSARLTQLNDQNAKDFAHVLAILQQDLQPEGVLEEILVEKIAYEYFRMAAAAQHYNDAALYVVNTSGGGPGNLLRYDSMINRQLFQAINQLERLQRLRRGEDVPAPLNVQI